MPIMKELYDSIAQAFAMTRNPLTWTLLALACVFLVPCYLGMMLREWLDKENPIM